MPSLPTLTMPHPPHTLPPGALHTSEFDRQDAAAAAAVRHLGHEGRCYGSMSAYRGARPGHLTVKNANVCTREHGKIWWGDCDVTRMATELRALADELGAVVYVLWESAGRFENAATPDFADAAYATDWHPPGMIPTQAWATAYRDAQRPQ